MSTLTAFDIRMILLELDCAVAHRLHADTHAKCIDAVREALLRAALADVEVEPVRGSSLLDAFHPRELAHARASG